MSWQTVGTITSSAREWTRLPLLLTNGEAFRITQTWTGASPGDFWVTIRSFYPGAGAAGYKRIYPSDEETLLPLPIPPELLEAGLLSRYLEMKLNLYAKVIAAANWSLTVEVWSEGEADGSPIQIIDAGVY